LKIVGDRHHESGHRIEQLLEVLEEVENHLKQISYPEAALVPNARKAVENAPLVADPEVKYGSS